MITLFQYPPAFGSHFSVSPFAAKVEAYLRLAGIEYQTAAADPRTAPRGKIPYIDLEGETVGDSSLILERLKARFGDPLDGELTAADHGLGHLIRRTLEEHLYWALLQSRWVDGGGWERQRPVVAAVLPAPLRPFLLPMIRRSVRKALLAHGLGRHDQAQIYRAGVQDLEACDQALGDKPYLLGEQPTSYDCSLFAMVNAILVTPTNNELTAGAQALPRVVAFMDRMAERLGAR